MVGYTLTFRGLVTICLAILTLIGLTEPCLAQTPSYPEFLSAEREVYAHEESLSTVAESLEEWLAGRQKKAELAGHLTSARKSLTPYRKIPKKYSGPLLQSELGILDRINEFSRSEEPDGEGQRRLFLGLSEFNEKRSLTLLEWRQAQAGHFLAGPQSEEIHGYFRWEASWLPIWKEEAGLTRRLQKGLLDTKGEDGQQTEVLKELLRLRSRADKVACPEAYRNVQDLSKERLTVLARTAEQLLRLEQRKSRGAVTRVRRLSRKLTEITKKFQTERLEILSDIGTH
jgi:hypothetical protein